MHRVLLLLILLGLCAGAPSRADDAPALTPKQALRELRLLERAFTDLHPGLYRYQSPEALQAEFADARAAVANGATPAQMYLLASKLSASVRCGHTWTNPLNQAERVQAQLGALPTLPFDVRLAGERMIVVRSMDPAVAAGDEVLAIDGRPTPRLLPAMLPYLRADGSNDGKRLSQLESTADGGALDRLLPLLFPPAPTGYALRLSSGTGKVRRVVARAVRADAKREALPPVEEGEWQLRFEGDTAVMTLPTFAFWQSSFDWNAFFQKSFQEIAARGVTRLVLDLRQNEGGDSAIGQALLSYLMQKPYTVPVGRLEGAYERAPYDLARYLDTWDFGFFDRTGKVVRGEGRVWLAREAPPVVVVAPHATTGFQGRTVLLTGPRMSSAGFLFARDAKAAGAATLVGETTGGNLRGLNGGELAWLTLPSSGVAVDIPLVATVFDGAPDSGVTPDISVANSLEDLRAGRDAPMTAAMAWLNE